MKILIAVGVGLVIFLVGMLIIAMFQIDDSAATIGAVLGAGVGFAAVLILWPRPIE